MSLAVIDASVLAVFYVADDHRHDLVVDRLKVGNALFAAAPGCGGRVRTAWYGPGATMDSSGWFLEL